MSLILLDASGLFHPVYHVTKGNPSFRRDGLPTAAVSSFLDRIWWIGGNVARNQNCTHGAIIFDHPSKNWRHAVYPEYKANRPDTDEDLRIQLKLSERIVPAFGMPTIKARGYEADDLIATYARLAGEAGMDTLIVSADKDFMQLVSDRVRIYNPMIKRESEKSQIQGRAEVLEYFGVQPERVCDVQALSGDTVDNIPGIAGIGIKTAAQLINTYGDLETLLENADTIRQPARRTALLAGRDIARTCRELVELDQNVDPPVALDALRIGTIDGPKVLASLKALEIGNFGTYFAKIFKLDYADAEPDPDILDMAAELTEWRNS